MASVEATIQSTLSTAGVSVYLNANRETVKAAQYIIWTMALMTAEQYGDDLPLEKGYYIQVNIWSRVEYFALAAAVRAAMEAAGFRLRDERDGPYDLDTNYHNRVQRYFYLREE